VAAGAGEARQAAEAAGATSEERSRATLLGAPTGLLDILAPEAKFAKNIIYTALKRGGIEGATEAAQKVAQNLIAKGVYNPEQPIFIGSGEEGAYGAGVGALASLLIDMTIGRRARLAGGIKDGTVTPPPGTPPTQLLGYTAEPFTPVAMPDGSVITSKADYDTYLKSKEGVARERQEDIRTSDPLAQLSPFERNLARTGKEAALEETLKSQEPDLLGDVLPPKETISFFL